MAAMFCLLGTCAVYAEPLPPSVRQEQLAAARERDETLRERMERTKVFVDGVQMEEKENTSAEEISFFIHAIKLEGNLEETDFLEELLPAHLNTEMGLADINALAGTMNRKLMDKGFVTSRVVLPEQNISDGTLRLLFIPGYFHAVTYSQGSEILPWRNAFPIRERDLLNIRLLEQGLEQMKRNRSVDAVMKLVPAEIPGNTDAELTVSKEKQISGNLSVDDSGYDETGKIQWNLGLGIDRLFNANDTFRFSANTNGERDGYAKGTRGESVYYAIPHGKDTWSIRFNHYDSRQTVRSNPYNFISSGKTNLVRFTFDHMISRTSTEKRNLDISIIKRNSKSYINDMEIPVQAMDTTTLEIGVSDRIFIGKSTLYLRFAQKTGTGWFGAQHDTDYADGPKTKYRMYLLDADYHRPFTMGHRPASYTASVHGQWTAAGKRLYSVEDISMGNRYTVRGFDGEYTLMGESGWYLRNELASNIPKIHSQIYLGLDVGAVYGPGTETLVGRTIAGAAVGMRGQFNSGLGYDVFLSRALYKPNGYHTDKWAAGFTLNWNF